MERSFDPLGDLHIPQWFAAHRTNGINYRQEDDSELRYGGISYATNGHRNPGLGMGPEP
jgi:hypothetical protein